MLWFSPSTNVVAQQRAAGVHVFGAGLDVVLTGAFADDFLGAFRGSGGPGSIRTLAALGSPLHQRLEEVAARGDARPWIPTSAYRGESILFLEVVGQCNERCVHCYAGSAPEIEAGLDEQTARRVVREAAALGFRRLQLTGGDPLLCRFLPELAREARVAGVPTIEVYTNGLALSDERLGALSESGVQFAFSFYSWDPARHDAMTQVAGSQRRTADAIRRSVRSGSKTRVSVIALDDDAEHLQRTREFVAGLGVDPAAVAADRVRAVGRGARTGFSGTWGSGAPAGHGGVTAAAAQPTWPGKLCVAYTGQVYPCIFSRWLPLGDIRTSSLRQILEGLKTRARGSAVADSFAEKLACFDCRLTALVTAMDAPR